MARGTLRIYVGAAPGVGKTFAMLNEGCRRLGRGTDVVVGYVETHGRALRRLPRPHRLCSLDVVTGVGHSGGRDGRPQTYGI